MRCQRKVRHDHRSRTTQFDLFAALGVAAVPTPGWSTVPEEARRALTHLMAQPFSITRTALASTSSIS